MENTNIIINFEVIVMCLRPQIRTYLAEDAVSAQIITVNNNEKRCLMAIPFTPMEF